MSGIVQGGWPYVWAAYIVSALVLGGYAVRVIVFHQIGKRLAQHGRR
jgi:heme exporter protein D